MKKLSLYLLSIIILLAGCQKDTDESQPNLKSKKDKDCGCKVLYLPTTITRNVPFQDSSVFKYHDKSGNLSSITSYNWRKDFTQLSFFYNNKNEVSKVELRAQNGIIYTVIVEYKDNKIYKSTMYSKDNIVTGDWTFTWNGNVLKDIDQSLFFEYKNTDEPAELIKMVSGENGSNIEYSTRNYWAKDIKNKELLFTLNFRQEFLPIKKEVIHRNDYTGVVNGNSYKEVIRLISADYNEANYPTKMFYEDIGYYYGDYPTGEHMDLSYTLKVTYEKVVIK